MGREGAHAGGEGAHVLVGPHVEAVAEGPWVAVHVGGAIGCTCGYLIVAVNVRTGVASASGRSVVIAVAVEAGIQAVDGGVRIDVASAIGVTGGFGIVAVRSSTGVPCAAG